MNTRIDIQAYRNFGRNELINKCDTFIDNTITMGFYAIPQRTLNEHIKTKGQFHIGIQK